MAKIGLLIDGKYEVLKLIGEGGMSKVYLAMDTRLNKQWAVKEISKNSVDKNNQVIVQSLISEANLMKRLDHPSLPRIVDIIDTGKTLYIIMDYIEGEPLNRVLADFGAQSQATVVDWALQLCDVLGYLHSNTPPIIYRDMKPGNVMLQPNGLLKLIDFGIAREYKQENLADTVSLGTKGYAAPEQFGGIGQTDQRTDIYCLGVTIYHLITGQNPSEPPYEIYPIRRWNPSLSSGLEKIINKCTQLNPADRYASMAELQADLESYEKFDDEFIQERKNKIMQFGGAIICCVLFLGLGFVSSNASRRLDTSRYLDIVEGALRNEDPIAQLRKAVDIVPDSLDAYYKLIEIYKSDADFTIAEQAEFLDIINPHLNDVRKHKDYPDLAFEIGKAYWFYNSYGLQDGVFDNSITRTTSSIYWFDEVISYSDSEYENYNMATIYREIGVFHRDIVLKVEEASDQGLYAEYFENIGSLLSNIGSDDREIVKLEGYRLIGNSIESYLRKFISDGITQEDMVSLVNQVESLNEGLATTTDKTNVMKDNIREQFIRIKSDIANAYLEGKR